MAALSGGDGVGQAATVVQWHRQGFRLFWRWRLRSGRPPVDREIGGLIGQMNAANRLWGAPRIHGELLKLGIKISQATVAKPSPDNSNEMNSSFEARATERSVNRKQISTAARNKCSGLQASPGAITLPGSLRLDLFVLLPC
jgi:hypothetical protein